MWLPDMKFILLLVILLQIGSAKKYEDTEEVYDTSFEESSQEAEDEYAFDSEEENGITSREVSEVIDNYKGMISRESSEEYDNYEGIFSREASEVIDNYEDIFSGEEIDEDENYEDISYVEEDENGFIYSERSNEDEEYEFHSDEYEMEEEEEEEEVCDTKACRIAAQAIMSSLDRSLDPCENFYHFSCDSFIRAHLEDETDDLWTTPLNLLEKKLTNMAYEYLDQIDPQYEDSLAISKMKIYYITCLEAQDPRAESFYMGKLARQVKKYGLWPEEERNLKPFELEKVLAHMHIMGSTHLFTIEYEPIPLTQFKIIGKVLSKVPANIYLEYAINLLKMLGIQDAKIIASNAFELQTALFKLGDTLGPSFDRTYNHVMLNAKFPQMNWSRFCQQLFKLSGFKEKDYAILNFLIINENYFRELFRFLEKISLEALKHYLLVNQVFRWSYYFGNQAKMQLSAKNDEGLFYDFDVKLPDEKCLSELAEAFEAPLTAQYVKVHFPIEKKVEIESYLKAIVKNFKYRINHQEWLDERTRLMVKAKLANTTFVVGYPDEFFQEMEDNYLEVKIEETNDHFRNVIEARKYILRRVLDTLEAKVNYHRIWEYSPLTVNAFNIRNPNVIKVYVGILNRPLFDINRPKYLNYGGIGMLLGHELSHGYDNYGINYNVHDSMVFTWPLFMKAKFDMRAQCIKEQYENYIFEDLLLPITWQKKDGLHDDISDVMGLQHSYGAYEDYVQKNGEEPRLLGTPFTNRQLFFIQFAQLFCTSYNKPWLTKPVEESTYSPGEFRVIGPIVNHPEFGEVFNCPPGTPMNPVKKCQLYM